MICCVGVGVGVSAGGAGAGAGDGVRQSFMMYGVSLLWDIFSLCV